MVMVPATGAAGTTLSWRGRLRCQPGQVCVPYGRERRELFRQTLRVKHASEQGSHVQNGALRLAITCLSCVVVVMSWRLCTASSPQLGRGRSLTAPRPGA